MTRPTDTPSPTSHYYPSWLTARQSQYHVCCARTAAHRFDCTAVQPERRERGPLWRRKP